MQNPSLRSRETMHNFWHRVPQWLITQDVIEHLILLTSQFTYDLLREFQIGLYAQRLLEPLLPRPVFVVRAAGPGLDMPAAGVGLEMPAADNDLDMEEFNNEQINASQSTHTASVHQSVSESALKLKHKHQAVSIYQTLPALGAMIDKAQHARKEAALRGLDRIALLDFTDPVSQVSIKELLCYLATELPNCPHLKDKPIEQADILIQGLYEIQRGYNIDEQGFDDNGEDRAICTSGTFNKLIETLQIAGVQECQIIYKTKTTATLKLMACVQDYCKSHHISEITEENWPDIKEAIQSELLEFKSLYTSDNEFEEFLNFGKDAAITS
jgi:hypothetical protein